MPSKDSEKRASRGNPEVRQFEVCCALSPAGGDLAGRIPEEVDTQTVREFRGLRVVAHDDLAARAPVAHRILDDDIDARHVEAVMRVRERLRAEARAVGRR